MEWDVPGSVERIASSIVGIAGWGLLKVACKSSECKCRKEAKLPMGQGQTEENMQLQKPLEEGNQSGVTMRMETHRHMGHLSRWDTGCAQAKV